MRRPFVPAARAMLASLAGCGAPSASGDKAVQDCLSAQPLPGEITVAPLRCSAQIPGGLADAEIDDTWLANRFLRAVVRAPERALFLPESPGGTLVDAAPWGSADGLLEVVPLIDGAMLDVRDDARSDGALTLRGPRLSLPGSPSVDDASLYAIRWTVDPDGPWILAEGADSLRIQAGPGAELVDGWLVVDDVVYGHDGVGVRDLGGAVIADGAQRLLVARLEEAWGFRPSGGVMVSGTTEPGARIDALVDDRRVGFLRADSNGAFAGRVPGDTTALRARLAGHAPSDAVAPGEDLELPVGARSEVQVLLAWPEGTPPRPVRVAWQTDEAAGEARLDPSGGRIATGPGRVTFKVDGGPSVRPATTAVDLPADAIRRVNLGLAQAVTPPSGTVLARLGIPDGRGPRARGLPADRVRVQVVTGASHVVLADDHLPARAAAWVDDAPWVRMQEGVVLRHPRGGRVLAWPWSGTNAIGLPRLPDDADLDAVLTLSAGALSSPRTLMVDLPLLAQRTRPWSALSTAPHLVWLDDPSPDPMAAWADWLSLLDEATPPRPAGPVLWIDADTSPDDPDPVAMRRAVALGALCAGTGPWLRLTVDGRGPGEVVPSPDFGPADPDDKRIITMALDGRGHALDRVALLGPEGILDVWDIPSDARWKEADLRPLPRVVVVAAWSTTTPSDWVVTAPITTRPPVGSDPVDTALLPQESP